MHDHPLHYLVTVERHGHVMHRQLADTQVEADNLAETFGRAHDTVVTVTPIHDPAETDLTTHTRELVEDLQVTASRKTGD